MPTRRLAAAFLAALSVCAAASRPAPAYVEEINGVQVITNGLDPKAKPKSAADLAAPHKETQAEQQSHLAGGTPAVAVPQGDARAARVIAFAEKFIGTPYVWGGTSPSGFDCSGFVQYAYASIGVAIPRTADVQYDWGAPVSGFPEPGDLVFFQTYAPGASHVGLYLGNGWFVNSVGTHVQYSSFASAYFRDRYLGARRVLPAV